MLAEMSSRQVSEWLAFCQKEPLPGARADHHTAMIVAAIYNVHRDQDKHPDPLQPKEFLPGWWGEEKAVTVNELSIEEQRAQLKMWAMLFGGQFVEG